MGILDRLGVAATLETELAKVAAVSKPGAIKAAHPEWWDERGRLVAGNRLPRVPVRNSDLGALVRDRTEGGHLVIEALLVALTGRAPAPIREQDPETGEVRIVATCGPGTVADMIAAAKILTDRGWGKAPQVVEVLTPQAQGAAQFDLSRLSATEIKAYLAIRRKALGEPELGSVVVEVPVKAAGTSDTPDDTPGPTSGVSDAAPDAGPFDGS
jgi:hypothetical protein